MKFSFLLLLGLSSGLSATVSYSIDFSAGTISDNATELVFATFTVTNGVAGDSSGLSFLTELDLQGAPNAASRNGSFAITLVDSSYSLSGVVWRSRSAGNIQLGGAGVRSNMATVGISLDQDGTLTTNQDLWTNGGVATTNLSPEPYVAGTVITHATSGAITQDDHWIIASTNQLSQRVNITKQTAGNIRNEVFRADLTFEVVPEPSSAGLLCLAGIGLLAKRRRLPETNGPRV